MPITSTVKKENAPEKTLSKHAKKINKRQAFDTIVKLKNGDTLEDIEVDNLLLYFAPAAPKKASNAMQWVAKAAAKQDLRRCLQRIWVKDGRAFASDGARLHTANVDEIDGWYDPKTLLRVDDADDKPPRFESILHQARNAKDKKGVFIADMMPGVKRINKSAKIYKTLQHEATKAKFLADQILEAVNHEPAATLVITPTKDAWKAYGRNRYGEYVVMGLRTE